MNKIYKICRLLELCIFDLLINWWHCISCLKSDSFANSTFGHLTLFPTFPNIKLANLTLASETFSFQTNVKKIHLLNTYLFSDQTPIENGSCKFWFWFAQRIFLNCHTHNFWASDDHELVLSAGVDLRTSNMLSLKTFNKCRQVGRAAHQARLGLESKFKDVLTITMALAVPFPWWHQTAGGARDQESATLGLVVPRSDCCQHHCNWWLWP